MIHISGGDSFYAKQQGSGLSWWNHGHSHATAELYQGKDRCWPGPAAPAVHADGVWGVSWLFQRALCAARLAANVRCSDRPALPLQLDRQPRQPQLWRPQEPGEHDGQLRPVCHRVCASGDRASGDRFYSTARSRARCATRLRSVTAGSRARDASRTATMCARMLTLQRRTLCRSGQSGLRVGADACGQKDDQQLQKESDATGRVRIMWCGRAAKSRDQTRVIDLRLTLILPQSLPLPLPPLPHVGQSRGESCSFKTVKPKKELDY